MFAETTTQTNHRPAAIASHRPGTEPSSGETMPRPRAPPKAKSTSEIAVARTAPAKIADQSM